MILSIFCWRPSTQSEANSFQRFIIATPPPNRGIKLWLHSGNFQYSCWSLYTKISTRKGSFLWKHHSEKSHNSPPHFFMADFKGYINTGRGGRMNKEASRKWKKKEKRERWTVVKILRANLGGKSWKFSLCMSCSGGQDQQTVCLLLEAHKINTQKVHIWWRI